MKQKSTFLKVFMTLMLLCGVSSVWGETATFVFNTDEGLAALGITKPSTATGTDLASTPYVIGDITMTVTNGTNPTRVWNNAATVDLRIYKNGGSLTFSAAAGFKISKVTFAGSATKYFEAPDGGTFENPTWSGLSESITLTATGTGKINTITVTYSKATTDPVIFSSDITIEDDATSGEIGYSITNPVSGKTLSATTEATWISNINVSADKVTFDATANTGEERTADVTLTYEGATNKVVKVTQKKYVQVYAITLATGIVGGTIEASAAEAAAGNTISLTAHPSSGYALNEWSVKDADNNPITVTNHNFTMPASNVTVSATFKEVNYLFYESFDTNDGTGGNDDKWDGSIASNDIASDNAGWTFANEKGANQCAKFGSGSKKGSAKTPVINASGCMILTFKAAAWNGTSESTTLNISTTSGTLSKSSVTLVKGAWTEYKITISDAENPQITFEAANASNNRFFLDEILITNKAVVAISSVGYSTYSSTSALVVPADETVYGAKIKNENSVELIPVEAGTVIAAGEGFIVKGEANGTVTFTVSSEDGEAISDNELLGTGDETIDLSAGEAYLLAAKDGKAIFGLCGEGTLGANKACLPAPAGANSVLGFDDATGIIAVSNNVINNGAMYNLAGQKVGSDYKGIVIVNGMKFLNK